MRITLHRQCLPIFCALSEPSVHHSTAQNTLPATQSGFGQLRLLGQLRGESALGAWGFLRPQATDNHESSTTASACILICSSKV